MVSVAVSVLPAPVLGVNVEVWPVSVAPMLMGLVLELVAPVTSVAVSAVPVLASLVLELVAFVTMADVKV